MKIRSLLKFVMLLVVGQVMFACNSAKYYEFAATKPEAFNKVQPKPAPAAETAPTMAEVALAAANEKAVAEETAPVLEASFKSEPVILPAKPAVVPAAAPAKAAVTEAEAIAMVKEKMASMTKAEKKAIKKEMKEVLRQSSSTTNVVEIILAIILPPLAVFLHDGIGTSFWINLILTLLFFLPGIIHALLVVTDTI